MRLHKIRQLLSVLEPSADEVFADGLRIYARTHETNTDQPIPLVMIKPEPGELQDHRSEGRSDRTAHRASQFLATCRGLCGHGRDSRVRLSRVFPCGRRIMSGDKEENGENVNLTDRSTRIVKPDAVDVQLLDEHVEHMRKSFAAKHAYVILINAYTDDGLEGATFNFACDKPISNGQIMVDIAAGLSAFMGTITDNNEDLLSCALYFRQKLSGMLKEMEKARANNEESS